MRRHDPYPHIADPLVRPLRVIMRERFRDNVVEVILTKNHKVIQALLLNGLDKPFDVGATGWESFDSDALRFDDFIELLVNFVSAS